MLEQESEGRYFALAKVCQEKADLMKRRGDDLVENNRIILSLSMQKEELHRRLETERQNSVACHKHGVNAHHIDCPTCQTAIKLRVKMREEGREMERRKVNERVSELEGYVGSLEAFVMNVRDDTYCSLPARAQAERLIPKEAIEVDPCAGCEGECGICDRRHDPDSRYQTNRE